MTDIEAENRASARAAGLRYVSDKAPGITRRKAGRSFAYFSPDGSRVRDEAELERLRKLAIPPAYENVWICQNPEGHIQATARDARGRKQYRYHPRWREARDETKFHRMLAFAGALPAIRERVAHDLALPGLPRDKALATVVRLLETTSIRIGNEEYARANESFGLTTLRTDHARVKGDAIRFRFRGKSGKDHAITVRDKRLAKIVRRMQDLPGQHLVSYIDEDGAAQTIDSADVNAYVREIAGDDFTAKDFRTWLGTLAAAQALADCAEQATTKARQSTVKEALVSVASLLGNTPAVCRKSYVHPVIIETFLDEGRLRLVNVRARTGAAVKGELDAAEQRLVKFLTRAERRVKQDLTAKLRASLTKRRASG